MDEPEIEINTTRQRTEKKKGGCLKLFIILLLVFVALVAGGVFYLQNTFDESYLRSKCEEEIARATGGECTIESIDWSVAGSAEIIGMNLAVENEQAGADSQYLKIARITANIDILKSIINLQPVIKVAVDGVEINIDRVVKNEVQNQDDTAKRKQGVTALDTLKVEGNERFSTNINQIISSIVDMPWRSWVAEFDWRQFSLDASLSNVKVVVHDRSELLKDIDFTLNSTARLDKSGVKFDLELAEVTPNVRDGRVVVAANVVFDWAQLEQRPDKPLAFIGSANLNLAINNLDLNYIAEYYIQTEQQQFRLGKPLSGNISLKADDLSKVALKAELTCRELCRFYRDGKNLPGGNPTLDFDLNAEVDLSRQFSQIKNGYVNIKSRNSASDYEWFSLNTEIFGSFAEQIVLSIQSKLDVGALSNSAFGRAFDFYNIASGGITLGSQLAWKRTEDWVYELNLKSTDLVIKNADTAVPAPMVLLLSGTVKPEDRFAPEYLTLQLKCDAPGIQVSTVGAQGLVIPLNLSEFVPQGEAKAQVDIPQVFKAFAGPLGKLGLKSVDEQLNLDFTVDAAKSTRINLQMQNTKEQYAPCVINLAYTPKSGGEFSGNFELNAEKNAVQVKATVEGEVTQDKTVNLNFNKQFAMRVGSALNLAKRVQNLVPGLEVAQYPVVGVIRGRANGKAVIADNNVSLSDNNFAVLIEGMTFTADNGSKFVDNKTSINGSYSVQDLLGKCVARIDSFKVEGDTINVGFKAERLGVGELQEDAVRGLEGVKGLELMVKVGANTFTNLSALLGERLPPVLRSGKSLLVELKSTAANAIALNQFEFNSAGLVAALSGLVVNPQALSALLNEHNYADVLKNLSAFKVAVKAGASFWSGLDLPQGLRFSGNADLDMAYDPQTDRLTLSKLILAGDQHNRSFVGRMSGATIIDNVSEIVRTQNPALLLESLPSGVNIPVVTIYLPQLKEFLLQQKIALDITGNTLELSKLRVVKAKQPGTLQVVGSIVSPGLRLGDDLAYKGSMALNNLIKVEGGSFAVTGELKLDQAQIQFRARPYVYNKPLNQPVKLYYKLEGGETGQFKVYRAGMTGGALQFELQNLEFEPGKEGKFALKLPLFSVKAPFTLNVKDVELNPVTDTARASVQSSKLDLTAMSSSLDTGLPCKLGGYIGAINMQLADRYSTLFGGTKRRLSAGNQLAVGASEVSLTSTQQAGVSMTLALGKLTGSTEDGKFTLGGMSITSPTGFTAATPVTVGQIDTTLDLEAMAQGRSIIDEVIVSSYKAIYELNLAGNNITALQNNINTLLPTPEAAGSATAQSAGVDNTGGAVGGKDSGGGDGILIKELYLNNGVVEIKSKLINTTLKLPQTNVKDIGGSNPRVAAATVLNVMLRGIGKAAVSMFDNTTGTAVNSVTNLLGSALKNKEKAGNEQDAESTEENPVKSVTNIINSVVNSADESSEGNADSGSSLSESLGNFFK